MILLLYVYAGKKKIVPVNVMFENMVISNINLNTALRLVCGAVRDFGALVEFSRRQSTNAVNIVDSLPPSLLPSLSLSQNAVTLSCI